MRDPAEYSRDYLVHYYEIDRKRRLTLPALMHYFEDIATLNSEARGFTLDRYARTGQLFLLLKWDIAVRSWPAFNETIRIVTRPTTFRRFLANREYAVFGMDGTPLAEARSVWIFTDMALRKPVRVPDEMYDGFGVSRESGALFDALEELQGIAGGSHTLGITVGSSDLDNNGHVNNVRYVEWALRVAPGGFRPRPCGLRVEGPLQEGTAARRRGGAVRRDRRTGRQTVLRSFDPQRGQGDLQSPDGVVGFSGRPRFC